MNTRNSHVKTGNVGKLEFGTTIQSTKWCGVWKNKEKLCNGLKRLMYDDILLSPICNIIMLTIATYLFQHVR